MKTSSTSRELQPILPAVSNPAGFSLPVLLVRNRPDRQHGEPVGVCHVFDIQFDYYPPMRLRRETKFSEEQAASAGAGGRQ
jgi:hypothetical protein